MHRLTLAILLLAAVAGLSLLGAARAPEAPAAQREAVLVGAGDIASCDRDQDEATAKLLDNIAGTVFTTGDSVYQAGTPAEFAACYDPTWGRHKARTRPTPGNHDYLTPGAAGYFTYFGANAGDPTKGYYTYELGYWKIIVLNSNCTELIGPDPQELNVCGPGSPQWNWLKSELETSPKCTLAYFHHPLFTSGRKWQANYSYVKPFWELLYQYGAEVILNGDDHVYERFAPQTPDGVADPLGVRQFTVGTGGMVPYEFHVAEPNSEVFAGQTHGVLKLTLRKNTYRWQFVPIAGHTFTDAGETECH